MSGTLRGITAFAALMLAVGTAHAQAGPAPGATNATEATRNSRETREEFNRAAGNLNRRGGTVGEAEAEASAASDVARAATPAEIVAGSPLSDSQGQSIGTIESVNAQGAVVAAGTTRTRLPLNAFGKNSKGLMLGITKAEFDAAVAKAAQPQG